MIGCSHYFASTALYTTALPKHSKSFPLIDCVAVGVGRMQRNFVPVRRQVEAWRKCELTDVTAKVAIYDGFRRGQTGGSKASCSHGSRSLFRTDMRRVQVADDLVPVQRLHSAFKALEPIPQFKATAKLGEFQETRFSQSF